MYVVGNIELIQTLNKLGHGVSYSQLEENDTALCLQKLATANQGKTKYLTVTKELYFQSPSSLMHSPMLHWIKLIDLRKASLERVHHTELMAQLNRPVSAKY